MEHQVKVIRISEEGRSGPDGRLAAFLRVDFKVGDHGPFTELLAKDGFTAEALRQKLETFARQIMVATGQLPY